MNTFLSNLLKKATSNSQGKLVVPIKAISSSQSATVSSYFKNSIFNLLSASFSLEDLFLPIESTSSITTKEGEYSFANSNKISIIFSDSPMNREIRLDIETQKTVLFD